MPTEPASSARLARRVTLTFRVDEDAPLTPFLEDVIRAVQIGRSDLWDRIIEAECEAVPR